MLVVAHRAGFALAGSNINQVHYPKADHQYFLSRVTTSSENTYKNSSKSNCMIL